MPTLIWSDAPLATGRTHRLSPAQFRSYPPSPWSHLTVDPDDGPDDGKACWIGRYEPLCVRLAGTPSAPEDRRTGAPSLLTVRTRAVPGQDDAYHLWYTGTHLPEVLTIAGYVAAQRFFASAESSVPRPFLALYELDARDAQPVLDTLDAATRTWMRRSDAIDGPAILAWLFDPAD
jgi:hypothetical protein